MSLRRAELVGARLRLLAALGVASACEAPPPRIPSSPAAAARPPEDHEASCGHGYFCVSAPTTDAELQADAPFASCAYVVRPSPQATEGMPEDVRNKLRIRFSVEETAIAQLRDSYACCYQWQDHCRGRPLRDGADVVVAPPVVGNAWHVEMALPPVAHLDEVTRSMLAEHWMRAAGDEHASVASFSRLCMQLMTLGAPPALIAGAHRAALDEVEHARIAATLASHYGGAARMPGSLPPVAVDGKIEPGALALETFRDGCIGETLASLELRAAADHAQDDILKAILRRLADDEERHALLAWRLLRHLHDHHHVQWPTGFADLSHGAFAVTEPALCAHGILGEKTRHALVSDALLHVVIPILQATFPRSQDVHGQT